MKGLWRSPPTPSALPKGSFSTISPISSSACAGIGAGSDGSVDGGGASVGRKEGVDGAGTSSSVGVGFARCASSTAGGGSSCAGASSSGSVEAFDISRCHALCPLLPPPLAASSPGAASEAIASSSGMDLLSPLLSPNLARARFAMTALSAVRLSSPSPPVDASTTGRSSSQMTLCNSPISSSSGTSSPAGMVTEWCLARCVSFHRPKALLTCSTVMPATLVTWCSPR
mmetsp:Transcript_5098/g.13235  ORF Transcript_5098/g.13235 Transcript_5098/m.13235 type:complete len:228 (+) Transcript_5098:153-836(+)